jgi:hypothetical protein
MMVEAGIRPHRNKRDDPFYAHFPELKTMLRDRLQGRRGTPLIAFVQSDAFMNNWSTVMRYCDGKEIESKWISTWSGDATQAVACIGT